MTRHGDGDGRRDILEQPSSRLYQCGGAGMSERAPASQAIVLLLATIENPEV
jgi:hypothetical protein